LNKFNKETISASFDTENPRKNLHKTKKLRKECYDRNNARNRDILTRAKASNQVDELYTNSILQELVVGNEDEVIERIDKSNMLEAISWLAEELDKDEKELEQVLIDNVSSKVKP